MEQFIIDSETAAEMSRNLMKLKKCQKIYSREFFIYLVGGIILILYSFVSLVGISWDWLFVEVGEKPLSPIAFGMLVDALITVPLGFFLAFRGSQYKHDLCAMFLAVLEAGNTVLLIVLFAGGFFGRIPLTFFLFVAYSSTCLVMAILNIRANFVYHWLEKQQGFPLFNARFEQQKENKFQRNIMDQYEQQVRYWKKSSADEMTAIAPTEQTLDKYEHEHKPSNMDDI